MRVKLISGYFLIKGALPTKYHKYMEWWLWSMYISLNHGNELSVSSLHCITNQERYLQIRETAALLTTVTHIFNKKTKKKNW